MTIDNLAERYKMLPSEILSRGSTFDLYVLDVSLKWLKYQREQQESELSGKPKIPKLTTEQMLSMIQTVRERKNDNISV